MGNILRSGKLNVSVLSVALCVSMLNLLYVPILAAQNFEMNLGSVGFVYRIQSIIEKIHKYANKNDINSLVDVMLDLEMEVEGYLDKKMDLDYYLSEVERQITSQGGRLRPGEIQNLRDYIKSREKRRTHKAYYLSMCQELDLSFSVEEEAWAYMGKKKKDNEKEEKVELALPIRLSVGITMCLCGFFLSCLPIPLCKDAGKYLLMTGGGIALEGTLSRMEDNENEKKNQVKSDQ